MQPSGGLQRSPGLTATLGRLGELEVRLARSAAEVRRAQALRYRVFFDEKEAVADEQVREVRRDADAFDPICDHLVVLDHSARMQGLQRLEPEIVGTYRLLRQEIAQDNGGFYTEREFALRPLLDRKRQWRFLELGRSCVLKRYRGKRTLELLWHGIWAYVLAYRIDVMIGCASLPGTDPDRHRSAMSFLHYHACAPAEWSVAAHRHLSVPLDRFPAPPLDARAAWRELPPLIKGYLRLGAYVGHGAVVDRQFGTTDICIVLPVAAINRRYVSHYGEAAERFAA